MNIVYVYALNPTLAVSYIPLPTQTKFKLLYFTEVIAYHNIGN